jgi:hypothetical protein
VSGPSPGRRGGSGLVGWLGRAARGRPESPRSSTWNPTRPSWSMSPAARIAVGVCSWPTPHAPAPEGAPMTTTRRCSTNSSFRACRPCCHLKSASSQVTSRAATHRRSPGDFSRRASMGRSLAPRRFGRQAKTLQCQTLLHASGSARIPEQRLCRHIERSVQWLRS